MLAFGLNPRKFLKSIQAFFSVLNEYFTIKNQARKLGSSTPIKLSFPCLDDKYDSSGVANGHYFHQDFLVAKKIFDANPQKHVDVASRIDGFVAHVAIFREIEVFDIRPLISPIKNLIFRQFDATKKTEQYVDYCDSLSCLHALEHFGLGRYGDELDFEGHLKGLKSLTEILKPGGTFYLSVPIGPERIEFNGHRVFSPQTILNLTKDFFTLSSFSYVNDQGDLIEDISIETPEFPLGMGCQYGCGIFTLTKKKESK